MSLKIAMLALLELEEGSGYDLVKRFNSSIGHFWSSTHQQVYKELQQLSDQGLVQYESVAQQGKPDKKIYNITSQGSQFLADWVARPAKLFKFKDPMLVKLFAGHHSTPDALLADLAIHELQHRQTREDYARQEARLAQSTGQVKLRYLLPYMTLRLGIHLENAWLAWFDEVKDVLTGLKHGSEEALRRAPLKKE